MNNQAAQTMPELPLAIASIHADGYWTTDDRRPDWKWPARQRVFSVDQMHQYARDYAAMLAAAPAASGAHPDALQDGTLSKSTAKRVEALTQQRGTLEPIAWAATDYQADGSITQYTSDRYAAAYYQSIGLDVRPLYTTTPQPSADAVRDGIRSLLGRVRPGSEAAPWVVSELESLLSGGSNA